MRVALFISLMLFTLAGCATTEADLKRLRGEVGTQRTELRSVESAGDSVTRYTNMLNGKSKGRRMLIGRDALLRVFKGHMPYQFKGDRLSKRIKGNFTLSNVRDFKLLSRNRAQWRWDFKGKGVSVNLKGVFGASKKDATKAKEALEGGGTLLMEGWLWVDGPKGVLRVNARCRKASLKRHNSSRNQGFVCDGSNNKLFRHQQAVPLPKAMRGKKVKAMTTANHLILLD
ncbi:MAG: hypothetical protein ACE366_13270 [Bradymonadia bacterium]